MPNRTLDEIRGALAEVQKSGQTSVDIPALLRFCEALEAELPVDAEVRKLNHDSQLAHYRAQHESQLAQYKVAADAQTEMFRSVIETAKTALTTSILVNGGATVALLAFLGNVSSKTQQLATAAQGALVAAVVSFAVGVLLGAAATGTTYCSQYCYQAEYKRSGATFHVLTVVLVVGTYVAFACGLVAAYHAFIPRSAA